MKKFGTPIGAAPGSASEIVWLPGVGRPSGCVSPASTLTLSLWLPSSDDEEDGAGGARSRAARRWLCPRLLRRLILLELLRFIFEVFSSLELLGFGADWRWRPGDGSGVVVGGGSAAAGWSVSSTGPPRSVLSSPPTGVSSSPASGSAVEPVLGSVPVAGHEPGSAAVTLAVPVSSRMWPPWSRHPADVSSTPESAAVPADGTGDCPRATSTPTGPPIVAVDARRRMSAPSAATRNARDLLIMGSRFGMPLVMAPRPPCGRPRGSPIGTPCQSMRSVMQAVAIGQHAAVPCVAKGARSIPRTLAPGKAGRDLFGKGRQRPFAVS